MSPHIDIVFDGPPGPEAGRFVEVENAARHSINFGEWIHQEAQPLPQGACWIQPVDKENRTVSKGDELEQQYVDLLMEVAAYLKFGGILTHHRNRVRAIGESIHDTLGFEYMQAFGMDLRELFNVSRDESWVGHPQELDFAWEGIGGWLP